MTWHLEKYDCVVILVQYISKAGTNKQSKNIGSHMTML